MRVFFIYLIFTLYDALYVMAKNILIDIDGTICEDIPNELSNQFSTAKVYPGAVESVNKFVNEGHTVTFFTARTTEHKKETIAWLDRHGFVYSDVIFNKPRSKGHPGGYMWIDNVNVSGIKFISWDRVSHNDLDECENWGVEGQTWDR